MLPGVWGRDVDRQPWTANLMHNARQGLGGVATGELRLTDTDAALSAELVLPDSDPGRETALLARRGVLKGISGEFDILQQYAAAQMVSGTW